MNIHEVLRTREIEIAAEIEALRNEVVQIKAALAALDTDTTTIDDKKPIKKEDMIVAAVRSGQKRPQDIHKFIKRKMNTNMNIGSLRSTLSRLKSEGRISHDNEGWVM